MSSLSFLLDSQLLRQLTNTTDEKVLEVVLVYNGPDRYDTVINPRGVRTDLSTVTIDYNHNGFNTGAYLTNLRVVENYVTVDGTTLKEALVGEIHVPKTAEMFYRNQNGEKVSAGNLYEAVEKGFIRAVSVEFKPYKDKQLTHIPTGITYYEEWDLLRVSLLDITPGQPYSGIKVIRSFMSNLTLEDIKQALAEGVITREQLLELVNSPTAEPTVNQNSENTFLDFLSNPENQRQLVALIQPYIDQFIETKLANLQLQAETKRQIENVAEMVNLEPTNNEPEVANKESQRTFHWFLDHTENEASLLQAGSLNNYRRQLNIPIDLD